VKKNHQALTLLLLAFAPMGAAWSSPARALTPTSVTVTNSSSSAVYVNLVLGQPPVTPPSGCTNLGQQITLVTDPNLKFTSSISGKSVTFTPQAPGINDKGYYQMAAGETIEYQPQTLTCGSTQCIPAVTFNFFFTPAQYDGSPNNGCGGSSVFPNATSLAEASINFSINGSVGSTCPNPDAVDISAVNGINAIIGFAATGTGWPFTQGKNGGFGMNANQPGVFGWAATNCINNAGYPNPSTNCAAPANAPLAPQSGQCTTPGGSQYSPIVDPTTGTQYCDERSDPPGQCLDQRTANVTGGTIAFTFQSFYPPSASQ
jgi:hypothetical protein